MRSQYGLAVFDFNSGLLTKHNAVIFHRGIVLLDRVEAVKNFSDDGLDFFLVFVHVSQDGRDGHGVCIDGSALLRFLNVGSNGFRHAKRTAFSSVHCVPLFLQTGTRPENPPRGSSHSTWGSQR